MSENVPRRHHSPHTHAVQHQLEREEMQQGHSDANQPPTLLIKRERVADDVDLHLTSLQSNYFGDYGRHFVGFSVFLVVGAAEEQACLSGRFVATCQP